MTKKCKTNKPIPPLSHFWSECFLMAAERKLWHRQSPCSVCSFCFISLALSVERGSVVLNVHAHLMMRAREKFDLCYQICFHLLVLCPLLTKSSSILSKTRILLLLTKIWKHLTCFSTWSFSPSPTVFDQRWKHVWLKVVVRVVLPLSCSPKSTQEPLSFIYFSPLFSLLCSSRRSTISAHSISGSCYQVQEHVLSQHSLVHMCAPNVAESLTCKSSWLLCSYSSVSFSCGPLTSTVEWVT